VARRPRPISSCFECAAVGHCFGSPVPELDRDQARERALACDSVRKGRTTETVQVEGAERGLSRKKVEHYIARGRAEWVGPGLVRLLDPRG